MWMWWCLLCSALVRSGRHTQHTHTARTHRLVTSPGQDRTGQEKYRRCRRTWRRRNYWLTYILAAWGSPLLIEGGKVRTAMDGTLPTWAVHGERNPLPHTRCQASINRQRSFFFPFFIAPYSTLAVVYARQSHGRR
ncbi:hypothetical protein BZA05DRAFT_94482 [Tricharina praecox]|uniref:uncharacterized protein n=1 Tax=Tricharina praecox TaxID=43433 RepID=UPI0022210927|nr:uncharacterized protein BZA05DRAFT_94482 [Tricharina praecox]KAI5848316.1 hypothetical protein BZA05DRAFT_94482 [Tricharina praecox]